MHLKMQQWILRVNGHTVKVLLSLAITIILAQIWELISMMWQNITSIASTRCRILLHLTWVRVTVLTLTPLLWCYTTSPSGQSVYFCIKNEIKHYRTFLPAWSKAWTFTTASRACRRCFCVSSVGVLHGQQIAWLPASSPCVLWGVLVYPSHCQHLPVRVPEPVPPLRAIFRMPGGLRWHHMPMPGHPTWPQIIWLSERVEGKLWTKCCFVNKGKGWGGSRERGFRSTKNFWELIANSLACYNQWRNNKKIRK